MRESFQLIMSRLRAIPEFISGIPADIRHHRDVAEMEMDHQQTRYFLRHHGEMIADVGELRETRGLVAVIEDGRGFIAFEYAGIEEGYDWRRFSDPHTYYFAEISPTGEIDSRFEWSSKTHDGSPGSRGWSKRQHFGPGTFNKGIYRITSEDLVNRVSDMLSRTQEFASENP